jgi:hypothetical protein
MAGKVFFSVSMSLDGFIAPESIGDLMGQQWMELQQWVFPQRFFRENLKLGEGGEEGRDNDIVRETFERTGPRGRRRPGRPHRGRRRDDPGVRERRPDRRVHDRALTRAVRLRNSPVRGRGRGPRGPGAGPRGADAAGDPPDLRSPGAVTGQYVASGPQEPGRPPKPRAPGPGPRTGPQDRAPGPGPKRVSVLGVRLGRLGRLGTAGRRRRPAGCRGAGRTPRGPSRASA